MPKILKCESLDNPPVGMTDVSESFDGFNVHVDQMIVEQVYSFQYDLDAPMYVKLTKDQTLMYFTKRPTNRRTD